MELQCCVLECVADQNGNHVIQKCIECIKPSGRIHFMLSVRLPPQTVEQLIVRSLERPEASLCHIIENHLRPDAAQRGCFWHVAGVEWEYAA